MGNSGSTSTTKASVITSNAVNALAQSIMNCKGNQMVQQTFTISGNYNVVTNTKQVMAMKLSSDCAQSVNNMADIQQSVAAAISQSATSQSASLLSVLGGSRSDAETYIKNDVVANITQQTVQNIVNTAMAQQAIVISGNNNIVNNFSQEMTLQIVQNNCQDVVNKLETVQKLNNVAKNESSAKSTNFVSDIIDSVFSGLTGFGMLYVIIIVVVVAAFAYLLKGGFGSVSSALSGVADGLEDSPPEYQEYQQMPQEYQQNSMQQSA